MIDDQEQDKSIPEKIIEDTFSKLQTQDIFTEEVIMKLKDIASKGNLKVQKSVTEALKTSSAEI
jgi:hypothetical protein